MYEDFLRRILAIAPVFGRKSEKEKFAGAAYTTTGEAILPGGKALQVCTSHNLGTNFAEAFGIQFLGKDGKQHYPYQTSWGLSWRVIGAMIITHGDEKGLIFPPKMAPIQVIITPIRGNDDKIVMEAAKKIKKTLSGLRVEIDQSDARPGAVYHYYELRGVPLRIEIGPRDIEKGQVVIANRLTGKKIAFGLQRLKENVAEILESMQDLMLKKAERLVEENTYDVETWENFKETLAKRGGFLRAYHCGEKSCEQQIQDETKATLRCIPFGYEKSKGVCIRCKKPSAYGQKVLFAKAY
jgi:prolyl-tRNA synthetase